MPKKKQVVHAEEEKREQNSALRSYLKDCGVRVIKAGTEIKLNPKFFPALSYSKPRDCFVIYFQSPHRFGEQSFFFDQVSSFCDRANENNADLEEASSLCFSSPSEDLDNAPAQVQRDFCLAVIKRFFSATTPTALNAAKRQNKKCRRRLLLKPKLATIKAALGCTRNTAGTTTTIANGSDSSSCCVDIGNENGTAGGAANNGDGTTTNNKTAISSSSSTTSPRRSQLQLPDFAEPFVQKAAREFNLNWFNALWEQYVAQKGRKAVKRREREKLEELFKDRVSRLQGAKEGV